MNAYTVGDFYKAIEGFAPFSLAESWDNTGLLVGSPEHKVTRALVALDATSAVIREAQASGAQLIATHHPIIFSGVKKIPAASPVYQAIQAGVAVICAHTNLDIATGGVNDVLADLLGLCAPEILETTQAVPYRKVIVYTPAESAEAVYNAMVKAGAGRQGNYAGAAFLSGGEGRFKPLSGANPAIGEIDSLTRVNEQRIEMLVTPANLPGVIAAMLEVHPYEEPAYDIFETHFDKVHSGLGRVGVLPAPMNPQDFARHVKSKLPAAGLRCVFGDAPVSRVAVCGGAGASLLEAASRKGAQALVTGEVKHNHMLEAKDLGLTLIDAGHYATEAVILPKLLRNLKDTLPGAEIEIAKSCADPAVVID
ncbi:MAG: Nif3-like dinuclear metal center hexameric protein [Oscillospiraceae bacterium]|nr:Nif3-like dinuclear metal center hexameric protein [Oscillospiraceae bacterium]